MRRWHFARALQRVGSGDTAPVRQLVACTREPDPIRRLTREGEIFILTAERYSITARSQALIVSPAAKKHAASIFRNLDLPADRDQHHRRVMTLVRYLLVTGTSFQVS